MSLFFILHGWIPSGQTLYFNIFLIQLIAFASLLKSDTESKLPTHHFLTASVTFIFQFLELFPKTARVLLKPVIKRLSSHSVNWRFSGQAFGSANWKRKRQIPCLGENQCAHLFHMRRHTKEFCLSKNIPSRAPKYVAEHHAIWRSIWSKRTTSQAVFAPGLHN